MSSDSYINRQIGNYQVKALLGEGGMGSVYLAEHPRIGRQVAIKIMGAAFNSRDQSAQRFEAEARLITRIEHPNVIEIFDFGALEDGSLYYVMELLRGRELSKVMAEKKKMSVQAAWPYVKQICAALQAAHDHGVVHRDLKLENIFVLDREPLTIKILDFGIAKLLEGDGSVNLTSTGVVLGTPLFIAPEQAAGEPDRIGPHTDIYSLGVLLYWMLGGQPPFIDSAPGRLMAKHMYERPRDIRSLASNTPRALAELINRCLAKEPQDRPGSPSEVASVYSEVVGRSTPAGARDVAGGPGLAPESGPTVDTREGWQTSVEEAPPVKSLAASTEVAGPAPGSARQQAGASTLDIPPQGTQVASVDELFEDTPGQSGQPAVEMSALPVTTTMRGATGEIAPGDATHRVESRMPLLQWVIIGVGAVVILGLVGALVLGRSEEQPPPRPQAGTPAAASSEPKPPPVPRAEPAITTPAAVAPAAAPPAQSQPARPDEEPLAAAAPKPKTPAGPDASAAPAEPDASTATAAPANRPPRRVRPSRPLRRPSRRAIRTGPGPGAKPKPTPRPTSPSPRPAAPVGKDDVLD